MSLETLWLALLGLLLAGYFVLGGYDYGAQMLSPFLGSADAGPRPDTGPGAGAGAGPGTGTGTGPDGRNAALDAIAPFFLGNEVWLVAFAGVMFGAFPHLEGSLLSGLYPLIVAILAGLVLGNAAIQLRGRSRGARAVKVWNALVVLGGALPAVCWGIVVGLLLHGVPRRADGSFHVGAGEVFGPFALTCGVATALLFAGHGAAFVALRSEPGTAAAARRLGATLLAAAGAAGALALLLSVFGAGASMTRTGTSVVLFALVVAALAAGWWFLGKGRDTLAFTATCLATALPVLLIGAGQYPYLLSASAGGGITVDEAVADGATLKVLIGFGVVVVPLILLYQGWSWWAFRGRTGRRHPSYF
ncbi:cytochrome d ubiquinol oxidase subunit II [Kitasatospora purpeofusca]|uniref:cytochrome d ubiquinol oxidase subunit II n=1 Tax=Kitasatospora purpeofusca TaxID=67352 RepID=UPI0022581887|nr:cytochrome d ubiquinol oxidase subunit II [Kitasatospora purpeofusca]MCX4753786.1 cytochrome d ubiquinol oxidase subunit II [Kitasatospora purpeofusca]WSR33264.1 cytochrome d ubiquinol oxidase subunit II [Kitasatospora purpeofusca]